MSFHAVRSRYFYVGCHQTLSKSEDILAFRSIYFANMPSKRRAQVKKGAGPVSEVKNGTVTEMQGGQKEHNITLQELQKEVAVVGSYMHTYRHLSKLGEGCFGSVHRAKRIKDSKDVAVKIQEVKSANIAPLVNELRTLKLAAHVNITRYFDSALENNKLYIVMEFVDGLTLTDVITHYKLQPSTIAAVSRGILRALTHIHRYNVIH